MTSNWGIMFKPSTILALRPELIAAPGTALLQRGHASRSVIFIESGRVAIGIVGAGAGRALEHQLGVVEGPSWLEATAAVLNLPSAVDAVALTAVQYRRLPLEEFRANLDACAPDVRSMLRDIARAHRQQAEMSIARLAKDAEARFAEWLVSHAETSPLGECSVRLQMTKRDIATQLGIVPETLSRVLRQLRDMGLIGGKGKTVALINPAGLRMLAGQLENGPV
jgi:CRP-like cAMP-binding protein